MTTIADVARRITELPGSLWTSYDHAVVFATSYIQCGGGQAPDVEIDQGTFDHIIEAACELAADGPMIVAVIRDASDYGYEDQAQPGWVLESGGEYVTTLPLPPQPMDIAAVRQAAYDALGYPVDARPIGGNISGATHPVVDGATESPEWLLTRSSDSDSADNLTEGH